jgi:dTDP-glucose pyrophosphorylase
MPVENGIILASGEGKRLRPLTYILPKPLVRVDGKPLIFHSLELLENLKVRNVVVTLEPNLGNMIKGSIEKNYFGDLNIDFLFGQNPSGPATRILDCRSLIGDKPFFVNFPDEFHPRAKEFKGVDFNDSESVLVVRKADRIGYLLQNTNVSVDENGMVIRVDRPAGNKPFSKFHLCGLMSFSPIFFDALTKFQKRMDLYANGELSTNIGIQHLIDTGNRVRSIECGGYYININTLGDLMNAARHAR